MRKLHKTLPVFIFLMLSGAISLHSQVKIGNNPQTIDASSLLELESIDKALVITRVSTAQMEAIIPSAGAIVYNTDDLCINYYDGTEWINICDAFGALDITSTAIENGLETIVITRLNEDGIEDEEGSIFNIEVSQINGDNIQDGVIDTYHIVDDAIGREQIAANAISTTEIADETIRTSDIRPGNTNEVLQISSAGNVAWAALNANNITGEDLTSPNNTISITNGGGTTIVNTQIDVRDEGITTAKLAADAVDNTKLADNAVQTENILDDAITSAKILDETITSEDILDGTIATVDILDGVITPSKLADGENEGDILRWNTLTTSWELANENALAITEAQDLESVLGFGADANATTITNLGAPANDNDAATKLYVDTEIANQIIISADADNAIIESTTDGGVYYDDSTKEDVANKSTDVTLADDTNTNYPTELAVKTYVDTEIANQIIISADADNAIIESTTDGGAYYDDSVKEDVANKSTDITLADDTNTNYPTELAVKTYVDTEIANQIIISADAGNAIIESTTDGGVYYDDSLKEDVANKSTDITLADDTNTNYPTELAVKTYIDNEIATINSLNDGLIYVGNATDEATAVSISGDASLINDGTLTILDDAVTIDKIGANAADAASFLGTDILGNPTWVSATSLVDGTTIGFTASQQLQVLDDGVTTTQIADATITNIDISGSAAIDGSKIDPNFVDQSVSTTGTLASGNTTITGTLSVTGETTINSGTNQTTLPTDRGTDGQVLTTNGAGVATWEDSSSNENLANTDLTQEAERTYNTNGNNLIFDATNSNILFTGTTSNIGIGTTSPSSKLHVGGAIRATGFLAPNNGTIPSYRFNDDTDTGILNPAENNLAFTTGGTEAIRIDASQNVGIGTTTPSEKLHISGNMQLEGSFKDENGNAGTAGQVLTSTGIGTEWQTQTTINEVADEFTATDNQTFFTLSQTPSANSKVKAYINGLRISNSDYSISGSNVTLTTGASLNDRVQFDYYY